MNPRRAEKSIMRQRRAGLSKTIASLLCGVLMATTVCACLHQDSDSTTRVRRVTRTTQTEKNRAAQQRYLKHLLRNSSAKSVGSHTDTTQQDNIAAQPSSSAENEQQTNTSSGSQNRRRLIRHTVREKR